MVSVFIIRIPEWRTFVFTVPENWNSYHLNHWFRRTIRSRLFQEIELGNDQAALQLARPWRLRYLRGEWERPLSVVLLATSNPPWLWS